jgi:transposase
MDNDKRSTQVERLEVVDTGRRRRSSDEKLKIVLESLQTPRQIWATARRYGISRSLLIRWRQAFRAERNDGAAGVQLWLATGDTGMRKGFSSLALQFFSAIR